MGGQANAVMVVGFEKMMKGSLQSFWNDRENPTGTTAEMMRVTRGVTNAPGAAQMFGNAGREYMEKYVLSTLPPIHYSSSSHLRSQYASGEENVY